MTPFQRQLLDACTPEWQTAGEIANRIPGPGYTIGTHAITPRLAKLVRLGHLERDTTMRWHRWRVR